jgi:hypothetical protein
MAFKIPYSLFVMPEKFRFELKEPRSFGLVVLISISVFMINLVHKFFIVSVDPCNVTNYLEFFSLICNMH